MAHSIFYVNDKNKNNKNLKSPKLKQVSHGEQRKQRRPLSTSQRKRRLTWVSIGLVLIIFAALIFLLNEQAKVLQITAENARIQYSIRQLTRENAQRREILSRNLDLDKIREEAQRLGLQTPHDKQIIEVKADQRDQIIVRIPEADAMGVLSDDEEEMAGVLANLDGFFKTVQ